MKKIIKIDPRSAKPKYHQIIDSVCNSITNNGLKKGDKIPSINQICSEFGLSRDTVMAAFNKLKSKGILYSQPGKGYYIATTEIQRDEKIFVLFDEFNTFKEDLYNSLVDSLKGRGRVELFFHNYNDKLFRHLVSESVGHYTSYIIMPATFDNTNHLLSRLPEDRVYMVDRLKPELSSYPVVYQDFELDMVEAMTDGLRLLKKYRKLVFVNPGGTEPTERTKGFERFCRDNKLKYKIIRSLQGIKPELYEAYFLISDRDLVELVKIAKKYKLKLGKKFGIVSFNDTMLKEVVAGGITTISTDFKYMGKTLANMVLNHQQKKVRNPSRLIVRKSL